MGWTGVSAGEPRWRWDLNPRTGCPVTRFRVLRTRVQPRSSASVSCSASPSTAIAEPSRTTTNETTTETMREGSHGLLTAGSRALTQAGGCGHPSRAAAAADVHPISHERALGLAHRSPLPLRYFGGRDCWKEFWTGTSAPAVASCTRRDDRGEESWTSTRSAQLRPMLPHDPHPAWIWTRTDVTDTAFAIC